MVQSLIHPDVHYPEVDAIDPEDVGYAAQVCEMAFPNSTEEKFMLIAIGKIKYTFHDRGILYYPIYLLTVDHDKGKQKQLVAKSKIGLVEVPVKHALTILDENKEVRLDLLEDPLLFAFANQDYLDRFSTDQVPSGTGKTPVPTTRSSTTEENSEEEEEEDDDDDTASASVQKARHLIAHGIFIKKNPDRIVLPPDIPEETETESKSLSEAFEPKAAHKFWVQHFLKNDRYGFHTVHGSESDSLFACLCDAFQQVGQDTTVAKLRAVVALEATASVFKTRREAFEHLVHKVKDKKLHLDKMKESLLLDKTKNDKDKDTLDRQKTSLTHDVAYDERLQKELVGEHFQDITSLQHFREFIMTNRFVPDDWALGVLEQKLRVKFIVLSESEFEDGDVHHVVHCFKSSNKPDYYIVLSKNKKGGYVVVTYKNKADHDVGKRIFRFSELPYGLRHSIGRRCSEGSGHGFQHIQEFDDLASKHGHDDDRATPDNVLIHSDENVRLQFYRLASLSAPPGKGPNEHVPVDQLHTFQPLRKIPSWRRKLDDTWSQSKFQLDGKTWASVVHYTQSVKFKKHYKEYADTFSLDSRTALSKNVDLALAATTPENKKTSVQTKPSQIEVDKDMTPEEALKHRVAALHAKFHQNADLQQLLKATLTAILLHYVAKRGAQPDDALMALRDTIQA